MDGSPIYINLTDDKGKSTAMRLQDFVEMQLVMELMTVNFSAHLDAMGKLLLEENHGKNGKSTVNVDLSAQYLMNFNGETEVMVLVAGSNLDPGAFDFSFETEPIYQCAIKNYYSQFATYANAGGEAAIPIAPACLANGGGL
jgi:hypothetical protein